MRVEEFHTFRVKEINKLIVFQDNQIKRVWHDDDWYFSVVDVVSALTQSKDAKDYWYRLKKRELEQDVQL